MVYQVLASVACLRSRALSRLAFDTTSASAVVGTHPAFGEARVFRVVGLSEATFAPPAAEGAAPDDHHRPPNSGSMRTWSIVPNAHDPT